MKILSLAMFFSIIKCYNAKWKSIDIFSFKITIAIELILGGNRLVVMETIALIINKRNILNSSSFIMVLNS